MKYKVPEIKNQVWKRLLFLAYASLVIAIATRFFINIAGVFSPGIAGVAQGATYTIWNLWSDTGTLMGMNYSQFVNNSYVILNWSLNIPIIIFMFIKLDRDFGLYSMFVIFMTMSFSIILTNMPGMDEVFNGEIVASLKEGDTYIDQALEYIVLISLAVIGGAMYGYGCGIVFKKGYSTMGFDPIAKYLEVNKAMNITLTLFVFSLTNSVFWIFVNAITSGDINSLSTFILATALSPTMFATIIFMLAYGVICNITYPSTRKIAVEIISNKYLEISESLIESPLVSGHTLMKSTSGYKKDEFSVISIIIQENNLISLVELVKVKDKDSIISTHQLGKVFVNHPI